MSPLDTTPHKAAESCGSGLGHPITSSGATEQNLNLELEFNLNTSTYATMFIRELTKNVV